MWSAGLARCVPDPLPRFGDRRRMRVGLLGGSFNPAHAGHRHVAELALRRLGLDQVWLMVSPGNPLKPTKGMAPLADRLTGAAAIGDRRRMIATSIEAAIGTRYSVDTLRVLRRRFPRVRFVWIMGADLLTQLPRWHRWREIVSNFPFVVLPRPGYTLPALAGQAAHRLHSGRRPAHEAPVLSLARAGWLFLPAPENATSATAIREAPRETKEPYHSSHAQTTVFTSPPSTQAAEARREARSGGGSGFSGFAAQEDHRSRARQGSAPVAGGEGGAVAAGSDAEADCGQPGG
jgi:nicotinate-nucleotide adenylyltransferase